MNDSNIMSEDITAAQIEQFTEERLGPAGIRVLAAVLWSLADRYRVDPELVDSVLSETKEATIRPGVAVFA